MKQLLQTLYGCFVLACLAFSGQALGQSVFINEIHYDNASTDTNEAIEIAGPAGTDLTGWRLVLYNGNDSAPYNTQNLSGVITDQSNGFGFIVVKYPSNGIQNGAPDGMALVNASGSVVQFLSYEGIITAASGPAAGLTSTDIGVSEAGTAPDNYSLQLKGTGTTYGQFAWATEAASTFNAANTGQTFGTGGGSTTPEPEPDPTPTTPTVPPAQVLAFINEIHYDNSGTDTGEGVEIAGLAGTDLTNWKLVPYNGNGGATYNPTINLSGVIPDQQNGFGTVFFALAGLQNGAPDGIALVDAAGAVIQFLSYEGSFTATNGPALGMTSTNIGVTQNGDTNGTSLQLTGYGSSYADFKWSSDKSTYNAVNTDQTFLPLPGLVFINEIHYDNASTDKDEAIELAGRAGTNLTGWSLILYNGSNGAAYNTKSLSGTIPNQLNGYGFVHLTYPTDGIQNGSPDGIALVDAEGKVVQFLSYEGTMTATSGPAAGLTSIDIGTAETSSTPVGFSLQLTGKGFTYAEFTWSNPITSTFGALNNGQSIGGGTVIVVPDPAPKQVTIAQARSLSAGTKVIINGTLTAADELGGPAFIQDATGGIAVFDADVHGEGNFNIGDSLMVTGSIGAFNRQVQLVDVTKVESFGPATKPIIAKEVSISSLGTLEGQLVTISAATFTDTRGLLFPESNYSITDNTGTTQLRIESSVEDLVGRVKPQTAVNITGVVGSFNGTLQLIPRFLSDLPGTTPYVAAGSDIPVNRTLDVMTWNMEFFGSTLKDFGPANDPLQLENARKLIENVHADIIAVQEISDEATLQKLVDMLPGNYERVCSDRFSYSFNGPDPTFPEQKLCFIYNTDVIKLVDERVIFEGLYDSTRAGTSTLLNNYPSGSPSSFWSSGRLPYMVTVDATVEGVTERVQLINLHAKSGSAAADLRRRTYDVQVLKDSLDRYYPNANLIILGDYNDDVDISISGGTTSYAAFTGSDNFKVVTSTLSEAGLRSYITQDNVIDHIAISNELFDNHLVGSESLIIPFNYIYDYVNTTSDHLPVITRFELAEPLVVSAGPDKTVYYGYAPAACTTLTRGEATGGTADYTYTWSTGETGPSVQVCPEQTTVYTLTVRDAKGRTFTDSVTVNVIDVNCGNGPNQKVLLCYNPSGKTGKEHTLCVSVNAVEEHLAKGATLGSCSSNPTPEPTPEDISMQLYPNPASTQINLSSEYLKDKPNFKAYISIHDNFGQELLQKDVVINNGVLSIDIRKTCVKSGLYYITVNSEYGKQTYRFSKE